MKAKFNKGAFFKGVNIVVALGALLTALFVDEEKAMREAVAEEVKKQTTKEES